MLIGQQLRLHAVTAEMMDVLYGIIARKVDAPPPSSSLTRPLKSSARKAATEVRSEGEGAAAWSCVGAGWACRTPRAV